MASYGCTNYFDLSTAGATLRILDSGLVDFLASPGVYNNREPGGYVAGRQMQDSFRLRGQFFIAEEDSRTHLENDFYRDGMRLYELDDALNTLKRDFARNICEDTFAWWFDQHLHGGRYEHEAFYRLFARQQQIARAACVRAGVKRSEIALIYDRKAFITCLNIPMPICWTIIAPPIWDASELPWTIISTTIWRGRICPIISCML